ncbi:hypothetical protein JDV02_008692 [Purpureocillium takamizusanense]|uniref:Uncharacterized protein n=1 Tax=Purpureocillium takamizusanense TaxID=2060973 RepID=A0A9Q8QN97_9HYPO|nr:uncharacterized protein JDV02_008692 [Purpureocillium takamizusanense]UNI22840.1 hypothetical protein JDV02_008692 [Purpureocillium takamizusanense]
MSQEAESGSKRAAEFNEAMLSVPGYADDSMFFLVRYGDRAKHTLRSCDWDDLQSTINQISELWIKAGGGGAGGEQAPDTTGMSLEERLAKAQELREHALSIVEPFPDLARDFDRFQAACRSAWAAMNPPREKK